MVLTLTFHDLGAFQKAMSEWADDFNPFKVPVVKGSSNI